MTESKGLNMRVTNERRVLTGLLKQLRQPNPRFLASRWPLVALWFVLALFFMLLFQVAQGYPISPVGLAIGSAVVGLLTGLVSIYSSWARCWPCIREHIDEQSISARLRELEGG